MLTTIEVATAKHVEAALKAGVDILWIGARTSANPFAVQEIADALEGVDVPVLVKNPVNPDIELWIGALERINRAGVKETGRHPPRLLFVRNQNLPQPTHVADSYRTASPHTCPAYDLRPKSYRRKA
jgi:hypothetical protein